MTNKKINFTILPYFFIEKSDDVSMVNSIFKIKKKVTRNKLFVSLQFPQTFIVWVVKYILIDFFFFLLFNMVVIWHSIFPHPVDQRI